MADSFYLTRSPNAHVRLAAQQTFRASQRGGSIFGRSSYLSNGLTPPEDRVGHPQWAAKQAQRIHRQRGAGEKFFSKAALKRLFSINFNRRKEREEARDELARIRKNRVISYAPQSGGSMRRSGVVVRAVGKRWGRAPRQYARGGGRQRGAGYAAIAKMVAKPALGVLAPMVLKAAAGGVSKLWKKRRSRQRGGNLRKLGADLVSSPQFATMLRRPMKQATSLLELYGEKGIGIAQRKLAAKIRGRQKGGSAMDSLKKVAAREGKIFAGNLMSDAADVMMQPAAKNFVRGMVKKKIPIFKNTAANKVWKGATKGLKSIQKTGRNISSRAYAQRPGVHAFLRSPLLAVLKAANMSVSHRLLTGRQRGGGAGLASLAKIALPALGAALIEPAAKGLIKMIGGGGRQRGGMSMRSKRRVSRHMLMQNRLMRAALQRGGRGNTRATNKVIAQTLAPSNKAIVPAALPLPVSVPTAKKTAGNMFNRVLNSNALAKFGNAFADKASAAVLEKVFG